MVRWRYIGLCHRLQHATASTGPSSRGVSPLVPLEEREHLRTAPFGASSLFDELATKLQLRDKVASQQRDYALYRSSAPFTVGKTRATPRRSALARSVQLWQAAMPMPLSFSSQQPFLATRGRGSGRPFHQRGGRRHRSGLPVSQDSGTGQPYRYATLDPLDIPRQVAVLATLHTRKVGALSLFCDVWRRRRCSEWVCNILEVGFRLRFRECPPFVDKGSIVKRTATRSLIQSMQTKQCCRGSLRHYISRVLQSPLPRDSPLHDGECGNIR